MRNARARLGALWRLGRPLMMSELGRILRLQGRDVGATIRDWEREKSPISGPAARAIEAMLAGWRPGDLEQHLRRGSNSED